MNAAMQPAARLDVSARVYDLHGNLLRHVRTMPNGDHVFDRKGLQVCVQPDGRALDGVRDLTNRWPLSIPAIPPDALVVAECPDCGRVHSVPVRKVVEGVEV